MGLQACHHSPAQPQALYDSPRCHTRQMPIFGGPLTSSRRSRQARAEKEREKRRELGYFGPVGPGRSWAGLEPRTGRCPDAGPWQAGSGGLRDSGSQKSISGGRGGAHKNP